MQARGPLMIEHRLIERMLGVVQRTLDSVAVSHSIDPYFVDTAVDFVRVYADRTHHGKEEDILFRDLRGKDLSAQDLRIMNELIEEHIFGRTTTGTLVQANERYRRGDVSAFVEVAACLRTLVGFYPNHIRKEDEVFFPASRLYFSEEEDRAMVAEFGEFDRKMIHEKYTTLVRRLETQGD